MCNGHTLKQCDLLVACVGGSTVVLVVLPAYTFSLFTILGLSSSTTSDFDFSQRLYFGLFKGMLLLVALYIDLDTYTLVTVWIILMSSTAESCKYYEHVLTLSAILCRVYAG